jgi:hypothetical protein
MNNKIETRDDCWGCVVRGKLHDALAGVDPSMPLELIVDDVFRELTLAEVVQCARETLLAWAEDERRPPRPRRVARLALPGHSRARGDHGDC